MRKIRNREIDTAVVSFGKTMTAIQAVNTLANYLDRVIAWKFLGPVAVATYSLAKLPVDKLNQLTPVNILALPKLSEGEIDFQKRKGILSKFLRLFVFFIPAALLVALLGPFLYRIVFPLYVDSVGYFQALTVLMAFVPFSLLYSVLVAEMRKRELYIVQISSPALKIIGLVILAPFYGIWGMIIAILGSEFLRGMMMLFFFLRSYKKTRP